MTTRSLTADPIALTARTRRVLALRRAIIEGTYKVDAEAVAAALIEEWSSKARAAATATAEEAPAPTLESMRRFLVQRPPAQAVSQRRTLGA